VLHDLNSGRLLGESQLRKMYAVQILHTVLVHVYLKIATDKIKTSTNMALKTAK